MDVITISIYNRKWVFIQKRVLKKFKIGVFCCLFDRQYSFRYGGRINNKNGYFSPNHFRFMRLFTMRSYNIYSLNHPHPLIFYDANVKSSTGLSQKYSLYSSHAIAYMSFLANKTVRGKDNECQYFFAYKIENIIYFTLMRMI